MKFSNPEDWNKFIERTLYYYDNSNKEFQINIQEKYDYLDELADIINSIKVDNQTNSEALANLGNRRRAAQNKFEMAKQEYEMSIAEIDNNVSILNDAKTIINDFMEFYRRVEAETIASIKEDNQSDDADCDNCKVNDTAQTNDITTTIKENAPQIVAELETLLKTIFGDKIELKDFVK
jgi:tetratricopeptide (TPR) repeat protein